MNIDRIERIKNKYRKELLRRNKNINSIHAGIKTIKDIERIKESCEYHIENLTEYSKKFKLVDVDYEQFKCSMGQLVVALNKAEMLGMSDVERKRLEGLILELHDKYKDIENTDIMKDYDVWN